MRSVGFLFYLLLPKSALPSTVLLFLNTPTPFCVKLIPLGRAQGSVFLRPASLLLPLLCHWLGEPDDSVVFSCSDTSALRVGQWEETIAVVFPDCLSWLEPLSCEPAETRQISILTCCVPGIELYPVSGCEVEDRGPRPLSSSCLGWVFCNIDLWEVRNTDNLLSPERVPGWELEREEPCVLATPVRHRASLCWTGEE